MEVERFEITVEDILNIHQGWIAQLFVQDRKSEVEIVGLLHDRRVIVTRSQIHKCLLDWGLIHPHAFSTKPSPASSTRSHISGEDWEIIPSPAYVSRARDIYLTHIGLDPETLDTYTNRPLPSLPPRKSTAPTKATLDTTSPQMGVELGIVSKATSPLEQYMQDTQAHELFAVGLGRGPRPDYHRAGDTPEEKPRAHKSKTIRKRDA